jgi:hypothetical protein
VARFLRRYYSVDRVIYNACIGDAMRGRKLTREQREAAFCVASKVCSGKAKSEDEAAKICALPKGKAVKPGEPQLSCAERMARVKSNLGVIELKVKSGEAEEVVDLAKQTLGDVKTCVTEPGTIELFDEAMGLVRDLGSRFYLKGEIRGAKSKIDILKELV